MNDDLQFIKNFSKITVSKACELASVDSSNLWAGRTSRETTRKVKQIIENEIKKLLEGEQYDLCNNSSSSNSNNN